MKRLHANLSGYDPNAPPLWMLCELSNADKHRSIHAILHYVGVVDVRVIPTIVGTVTSVEENSSLEDGTVIARIAVPRPLLDREKVKVYCAAQHGVVIAPTTKTPVAHLGMTIDGIKNAVDETVQRLGDLLT